MCLFDGKTLYTYMKILLNTSMIFIDPYLEVLPVIKKKKKGSDMQDITCQCYTFVAAHPQGLFCDCGLNSLIGNAVTLIPSRNLIYKTEEATNRKYFFPHEISLTSTSNNDTEYLFMPIPSKVAMSIACKGLQGVKVKAGNKED